MSIIKIIGFDPSTSNFGMAQCELDSDTMLVEVKNLILAKTASKKLQGVRKQSDDMRRAHELREAMFAACVGHSFAVAELPFFSPAAYPAANYGSGLTLGVLSGCPIPLIEITPRELRMASVGHTGGCKEEMIEWGLANYPLANWRTRKLHGKMLPTADNEHLADAIAAVLAGAKTQQIQQVLTMYRTMQAVA